VRRLHLHSWARLGWKAVAQQSQPACKFAMVEGSKQTWQQKSGGTSTVANVHRIDRCCRRLLVQTCHPHTNALPPMPPMCSVLLLVDASIPPMPLDISCAAWFAEAEVGGRGVGGFGYGWLEPVMGGGWTPLVCQPATLELLFRSAQPCSPPPQVPFTVVFTKLDKRKKGTPPAEENIAAFEAAVADA